MKITIMIWSIFTVMTLNSKNPIITTMTMNIITAMKRKAIIMEREPAMTTSITMIMNMNMNTATSIIITTTTPLSTMWSTSSAT